MFNVMSQKTLNTQVTLYARYASIQQTLNPIEDLLNNYKKHSIYSSELIYKIVKYKIEG